MTDDVWVCPDPPRMGVGKPKAQKLADSTETGMHPGIDLGPSRPMSYRKGCALAATTSPEVRLALSGFGRTFPGERVDPPCASRGGRRGDSPAGSKRGNGAGGLPLSYREEAFSWSRKSRRTSKVCGS